MSSCSNHLETPQCINTRIYTASHTLTPKTQARALTEVPNDNRLLRVRRPLAVRDLALLIDSQAELLVPARELVIAALVLRDGVLPLLEAPVAVGDRGQERLEPGIAVEDRLGVEVGRAGVAHDRDV